jgi:hypothetical protein
VDRRFRGAYYLHDHGDHSSPLWCRLDSCGSRCEPMDMTVMLCVQRNTDTFLRTWASISLCRRSLFYWIRSQALIVQEGPLTSLFGVSWSHTYRHTVGLLWTSDQPVAEASTYTGQHKRQTSMPRAGLEPATPATKRPQTYALDRAATGISISLD